MSVQTQEAQFEDTFSEAVIEDSHIRNVLLAGKVSKNGYSFSDSAWGDGSRFEGTPIFLDHGDRKAHPLQRSVREVAGVVRNPRIVNGVPRGDIEVADTDSGRSLRSLVKLRMKDGVLGFSQTGAYEFDETRRIVKDVDPYSADLVLNPATTKSAFSETHTEEEAEMIEELRDEIEALREEIEALRAERKTKKSEGYQQGAKERTEIRRKPWSVEAALEGDIFHTPGRSFRG